MANESEQEVIKYTVDIGKLDAEIKKLQTDNDKLRKTQENLNTSFKKGQISASDFKTRMEQSASALKKNQNLAKDLVGSIGSLSGPLGGLASQISALFSGPLGVISVAIGAITAIYNQLEDARQKDIEKHKKYVGAIKAAMQDGYEFQISKAKAAGATEVEAVGAVLDELRARQTELEAEIRNLPTSEKYLKASAANRQKMINDITDKMKATLQNIDLFMNKLSAARKDKVLSDIAERYAKEREYIKEQADLRKTLEERIKDLQILTIEDANEQKIAKIKLEEERQIAAYDKMYNTADAYNKKMINKVKALIRETSAIQIKAIKKGAAVSNIEIDKQVDKIKKFIEGYQKDFKFPDPQTRTEIEKLNGLLTEEAYIIRTRNNEDKKFFEQRDKYLDDISTKLKKTLKEISDLETTTTDETLLGQLNDKRLEAQREYENNRAVIIEETNDRIEQNHLETAKKIEEIQKESASASLQSWSGALGGMGDLFNALADTQEENSRSQLNLQKMAIYMSMASGLATAIAEATKMGWPAMLISIPAAIAQVVASFAQVKKLESQAKGYSTGGSVYGPGDYDDDKIPARLSNGEAVMTSRAVSHYAPLLSAVNQSVGGAPIRAAESTDYFAISLARALRSMPNPVVSVESIDRATKQYKNVEVISRL